MNFQEQLLLSVYLIKSAGAGGAIARAGARGAARAGARGAVDGMEAALRQNAQKRITQAQTAAAQAAPAARSTSKKIKTAPAETSPAKTPPRSRTRRQAPAAPAAINPWTTAANVPYSPVSVIAPAAVGAQGLALARQGFGQVGTGLNQALRSGLNTARERIGAGLNTARERIGAGVSSVGQGISSAARNPLVQAGGVGLLGGAVGAYGMNRLMGGGASEQQTPAAPAATPAATPAAKSLAPAAPAAAPDMTDAEADEQGVPMTAPVSAPAAPNNDEALRDAFGQYMGGSYNANSALDRAKFKYLQDLQSKGLPLNAANIYNKSLGYGNWKY